MRVTRILRGVSALAATVVLGGLCAATLVRLAPGSDVDEREFDSRLNDDSRHAARESRAAERNLGRFYVGYLAGIMRGDFGVSHSLRRPVRELLAERGPVTLRLVTLGIAFGWVLGVVLAIAAWRIRAVDFLSGVLSATLLSVPAAVLGLAVLFAGAGGSIAIGFVVLPKVFTYTRSLIAKAAASPHVLLARAKGAGGIRILAWHIGPALAPELLSLAGVSISLAFGAAIPMEAVCDIPGLGQLAWQAALGRDLPVLVILSLLLTIVTLVANGVADAVTDTLGIERAA
jgi:peptide/nickel transport system permease protein